MYAPVSKSDVDYLQNNTMRQFISNLQNVHLSPLIQTLTTLYRPRQKISHRQARCLANALQYNTVRLVFYSFAPFSSVSFNADTYYPRYNS
jgi:uncharacterized membrane protein